MRNWNTWAAWGSWGTRLLTGVLVAGVLGCSADAEPEGNRNPAPDPAPDLRTAPDNDPCSPEPDPQSEWLPRMCAVADAWRESDAPRRWVEEFHPLDPDVQLPEGGLRDFSDAGSLRSGSFRVLTSMPDEPADGAIRWEDGETRSAPLMSAADAFGEMDSGIANRIGPDYPALEVTGVEPGEMRVNTSRGPAQVPAWLFTLDGYDTPLRHTAVAAPERLAAPVGPAEIDSENELEGVEMVGPLSRDSRRITVTWEGGGCVRGDVDMLETDASIVFARSGGPPPEDAVCTAEVRTLEKTLELDRPLGERAPLDASTGEVLQPVLPPE
jgi:hypothetical protein